MAADLLGNVANITEQYVRPCADGSFCCEAEKPHLNATVNATVDTCCEKGRGFLIQNDGKVSGMNPDGTPVAANSTSLPTHSPTPTPKSNTGAIAGGVVGGVVGLIVVAGAIWLCLRARKRRMGVVGGKRMPVPMEESRGGYEMVRMTEMDGAGKEGPVEKSEGETFEKDGDQVMGERRGPHEL